MQILNANLKTENKDLKARVDKLEAAAEAAEQYSRRNYLLISGISEEEHENINEIILDVAQAMDIEFGYRGN